MTEPKSIHRLEDTDDGRLRVVETGWMQLDGGHPKGNANALTREYPSLWMWTVPKKGGPERVRVGTAAHTDETDGWFIDGANGIYAEVPIVERELSDAETAYASHPFHNDHETLVEIKIPHPEDLRSAILDEDLSRFDCLDAVVTDPAKRHDALTTMQERIAEQHALSNQLNPRTGIISDVPPEWNPGDEHNDGKSRQHLYDMASMREDAHLQDFMTVAGFRYGVFRNARWRVLGIHEPNLDPYEFVPVDVAGHPEWTYCRECGAVGPDDVFLHVDLARRDYERCVCESCAETRAGWDHAVNYTPENVARAKDECAQEQGGQRNLAGEYGDE